VFRVLLCKRRGQTSHIAEDANDTTDLARLGLDLAREGLDLAREVINSPAEGLNLSIDSLDAPVRGLALASQRFGKTFECQRRVRGHSCPLARAS
jgi:hypothetical protein